MSFGKEELNAIIKVMQSGKLSGYQGNYSEEFNGGDEVKDLEKEWALYFGVKHAVFCNSATSGLWAACNAIGLGYGDECLVTPYSMTCSASIPLLFGAKPVFVDIEPEYYCMNPLEIESKITDKTKAIIAVSLFGQPCDFDVINTIAKKHGLIVIEDAAQSIGAKYKGKYSGALTDIGVFSLNRHKIINCGEGGMITTDNDDIAFKLKLSVNHSEAVVNDIERKGKLNNFNSSILSMVGMNLRGTELSAAIAREQLKKLDGILENIREHAKYFPVKVRPGCEHAYYRYAFDKKKGMKGSILSVEDILVYGLGYTVETYKFQKFNFKKQYITPLYKMPLFQSLGYPANLCPVCEEVDENIVLAWLKDSGM